ncbi:aspartate carbamoyltransferase catalytic subunit [Desulfosudis oleivorans]|uniref:Aspartate carbamoyltransferase catalytic subunit n=1 Tax=Desulfosudis oleivorans (strain DSM 6200 / JCM 39069 / Hxd3) TaxID=96561 RepID=PYRB_DESOH|nr:aspartate carbamoyltransferase catalytic subunit [Desulfosudis oleivorans]A8ZU12.1 RecName: Full=Aspartate carbamoyltransferase catalytic subunit; AltName: Full=Aspartate transcarbamylase; Short=ATCase [Desulfosudis oleivorans Hxd3]ABW66324.1 aspartate carbamoyltransferase [Desulfosudis oleivorans Hxd3]
MGLSTRDILDMGSLSRKDISLVLDTARSMKEISLRPVKKVPTLRGKTVVSFFYEPSTRTKVSFDVAAKRLSADSISLSVATSSMTKGETLLDTVKNLERMSPDVVVIRHSSAGVPHMLARHVSVPVINAGDGMHAHPSQALLDMMTVQEKKGRIEGLRLAIIGDIARSRVARSNVEGFLKMGASVVLAAPPTMIPVGVETFGADVTHNVDEAIAGADVIMMLRIQKERAAAFLFSTVREYARTYGLTANRLKNAKKDVLIMHPGPVNRGVEIAPEVADGPYSVILDQVENGVAVRMALFYLVMGGQRDAGD